MNPPDYTVTQFLAEPLSWVAPMIILALLSFGYFILSGIIRMILCGVSAIGIVIFLAFMFL